MYLKITDVSSTISIPVIGVSDAPVPETSVIFDYLTQLIASEDFINSNRCESFSSYIFTVAFN
jgi:hypothetical protein